ncbi:MAG: methyl-accepting chemotaxis protein [Lachnospiraceae bacterium]|nr:methyl-accepting chemotaxis protein [Lachnospiraceae bacterium]
MSKKGSNRKGSFFSTVRGKFLVTGALGVIAAVFIGLVGMSSISRNSKISEMVSLVDDITVKQSQNLANDALYQYYVDQSYIDATLENLNSMNEDTAKLKSVSDASYASSIATITENVTKDIANYEDILSIHNTRGFEPGSGLYKQFNEASNELRESFSNLVNNNDWVEIKWIDVEMGVDGEDVTIDGQEYTKLVYDRELPLVGKRNSLGFRVGGTFTYDKNYYITDITISDGVEEQVIDLSKVDQLQLSGDGLAAGEITEFNGGLAIKITGKFNEANETWEEVSSGLTVVDYDLEKYPNLHYNIYFEKTEDTFVYKYGGFISGVYGFAGNLDTLDGYVKDYSKLVVEGKDVSADVAKIDALIADLETNIPKYTTDPALAEISLEKLAVKKDLFEQLKAADERMLVIKAENEVINSALTEICASIQNSANADMEKVLKSVSIVIALVLVIAVAVLAIIVVIVSRSITKSVKSFKDALEKIAAGNVSVRADHSGNDEFAEFSESLNGFMDNLEGTIVNLKDVTRVLAESGNTLEMNASRTKDVAGDINSTISEITKGAGEQANDIEDSSQKILNMRGNINDIVESVNSLSDTSITMSEKESEASAIMDSLIVSSDKTTAAFEGIAAQVRKTDESVEKIAEAVDLIASIASQTNLLSLNASIEAARAGEAGRGFAVVASEISKLAEQTNTSAGIIEGIITMLSEESKQTVETIGEVTAMIEDQKKKVDETQQKFTDVSEGIRFTSGEVREVLKQAEASGKAGEQLVDLMTNLSAISEENAASAETTNEAMHNLNEATVDLAETAQELKRLSHTLSEDLDFFKID